MPSRSRFVSILAAAALSLPVAGIGYRCFIQIKITNSWGISYRLAWACIRVCLYSKVIKVIKSSIIGKAT